MSEQEENISGIWRNSEDCYPEELIRFARRRLKGLLHPNILAHQSLQILLESAYLQGLTDASESLIRNKPKDATCQQNK